MQAYAGQVNGLPASHASAASRSRQQATQVGLLGTGHDNLIRRQQLKGQRLQGITSQQGVHQRIGVNQFHRTRRAQRGLGHLSAQRRLRHSR